MLRRGQRVAALVAGACVLVAGGTVALRAGGTASPPTASGSARTAYQPVDTPRPLTYAEGRTIHYGRRSIDTGVDLLALDLTDDGVAFTTFDGLIWFTDGKAVTQIGLTSPARMTSTGIAWGPAGRPNERVVSANHGSRLAWLEFPQVDDEVGRPEMVVYDTRLRRRLARVALDLSHDCAQCGQLVAVRGDDVYWTDSLQRQFGSSEQSESTARLFRYDVSTGRRSRVAVRDYQRELRSTPRTLVVGGTLATGTVGDGINQDFAFVGRSLVAAGRGTGRPTFDPVSRERLQLEADTGDGYGYGAAERLYLFQWLDDDSFALLDGTGWNAGRYRGEDVLVCRLSTDRCTVVLRRRPSAVSPIVPEIGTPGSQVALARAVGG